MRVTPRHYPHPVLTSYTEDFRNSYFQTEVKVKANSTKQTFEFHTTFDLFNDSIQLLIEEGKAVFSLHIECASTMKRILKNTKENNVIFEIPQKELNRTVTVIPFVLVMDEVITGYVNSEIDDFLKGITFDVRKGDPLAIGNGQDIIIEKPAIADSESIFTITEKSSAKSEADISFNPNGKKIEIYLPAKTYEQVKVLSRWKNQAISDILTALIYAPALVDALIYAHRQISDGTEEAESISDTSWFQSILPRIHYLGYGSLLDLQEEQLNYLSYEILEASHLKAVYAIDNLWRMEDRL